MKYYSILFKFVNIFLVLFFTLGRIPESDATILQNPDQVRANKKQAQELMNTNKNAQALDLFERTGRLQQSIYKTQRDSIARALQENFQKNKNQRLTEIASKQDEIRELKSGNKNIDRENFKMVRNTLFFFGVLLGLAVIILLNRFQKLSGLKTQLITSEEQLAATEKTIALGEKFSETSKKLLNDWNEVMKGLAAASPMLLNITNNKQHPLHRQVQQLQSSAQSVQALLTIDHETEHFERLPVDLNQMIEEVVSQAYYYICSEHPDFNCTIVKDLEKILPKVELLPADIRLVLFNLLSNAFEAVRDKRTNAPKGYEPKVTISTRKLPRFVQIRVRDNGTGITEKNPEQVFLPFYSSKNSPRHTGLGLTESKRIITGNYKGELFIESDFTTGTDFIIRFPILTIL